jgi:hypothetical protein
MEVFKSSWSNLSAYQNLQILVDSQILLKHVNIFIKTPLKIYSITLKRLSNKSYIDLKTSNLIQRFI